MNKSWITLSNRYSDEYQRGVQDFIDFAKVHLGSNVHMLCPCIECGNLHEQPTRVINFHLVRHGILPTYTTWKHHGEAMSSQPASTGGVPNNDTDTLTHNRVIDHDELPNMVEDIYMSSFTNEDLGGVPTVSENDEFRSLFELLDDAKREIYTGCQSFSVLSFVVKIFDMKVTYKWSDRCFDALMQLLKELLPKCDEKVPWTLYETKKFLRDLEIMDSHTHSDANATSDASANASAAKETRKHGPTEGKGTSREYRRNGNKRLIVKVDPQLKSFVGENATKVANEFGVSIRHSAPLTETQSWKNIDGGSKNTIVASVLEKFEIEGYGSKVTNKVINAKCQDLFRDWKSKAKIHYMKLLDEGKNPYIHPPSNMRKEQFKHMIDYVWKSEGHKKKSAVNKENCSKKIYNHTMGSTSFAAAISKQGIDIDKGEEYTEFFKQSRVSQKTGKWVDPLCEIDYNKMNELCDDALLQESEPMSGAEISQRLFGIKKSGYLKGFGPTKRFSVSPNSSDPSIRHANETIQVLTSTVENLKDTCETYKQKIETQDATIEELKESLTQMSNQQTEFIKMMLASRGRGEGN